MVFIYKKDKYINLENSPHCLLQTWKWKSIREMSAFYFMFYAVWKSKPYLYNTTRRSYVHEQTAANTPECIRNETGTEQRHSRLTYYILSWMKMKILLSFIYISLFPMSEHVFVQRIYDFRAYTPVCLCLYEYDITNTNTFINGKIRLENEINTDILTIIINFMKMFVFFSSARARSQLGGGK